MFIPQVHGRDGKWTEKLKERELLEYIRVDGRGGAIHTPISKWSLKSLRMLSEFTWLRTVSSGAFVNVALNVWPV